MPSRSTSEICRDALTRPSRERSLFLHAWLMISFMTSPWAQPNCTADFGVSSGCAFFHACAARAEPGWSELYVLRDCTMYALALTASAAGLSSRAGSYVGLLPTIGTLRPCVAPMPATDASWV